MNLNSNYSQVYVWWTLRFQSTNACMLILTLMQSVPVILLSFLYSNPLLISCSMFDNIVFNLNYSGTHWILCSVIGLQLLWYTYATIYPISYMSKVNIQGAVVWKWLTLSLVKILMTWTVSSLTGGTDVRVLGVLVFLEVGSNVCMCAIEKKMQKYARLQSISKGKTQCTLISTWRQAFDDIKDVLIVSCRRSTVATAFGHIDNAIVRVQNEQNKLLLDRTHVWMSDVRFIYNGLQGIVAFLTCLSFICLIASRPESVNLSEVYHFSNILLVVLWITCHLVLQLTISLECTCVNAIDKFNSHYIRVLFQFLYVSIGTWLIYWRSSSEVGSK